MVKLVIEIEELKDASAVNVALKTEKEQPAPVEDQIAQRISKALQNMQDILNPSGLSSD